MVARAYRRLLGLLPRGFREEFGDEMCEVVEEQWREFRAGAGPAARVRFWVRQSMAVLRQAVTLRMERVPLGTGNPHPLRSGPMDGLLKDARHAIRSFRRHPGFAAITILTLALGIGATTTVFSAIHAVLFRPLPYEDADRVMVVFDVNAETGERGHGTSAANIRDMREAAGRLSEVAVAEPWSLDLRMEDRTETLRTWKVSEGFFEAIGTHALLGRTFLPEEYIAGNDRVVVLGYRSWVNRYSGDRSIVGGVLTLDNQPYQLVGVLPEGFRFPDVAEAWIPRPPADSSDGLHRAADFMTGISRLAPGATLGQAQEESNRIATTLAGMYPRSNRNTRFELTPLREHLFGDVRTPLLVLFGAVGFVLLIACANVAGLILARGAQRQREYALRSALGAGKGRLFAHVTLESLVLAMGGCLLGIALTWAGVRIVSLLGPDHLPRIDELRVDGMVLAFAVACAGLSALVAGLAPSLRLSRPDLRGTLSEGARGSIGNRRGRSLRSYLVIAEVALAVVLLIGAGLLFKSFAVLLDKQLGFEPEDRVALQVFAYDYPDAGAQANFVNSSIENMEAIPGVARVALTTSLPGATDGTIASIDIDVPFIIEGRLAPPSGQAPLAAISSISSSYLEVVDIPLVAGRSFDDRDHAQAPPVILINETFQRRHFDQEDPLGKKVTTLGYGRRITREIIGVVRDTRPFGHESEPRPEIFFPLTQLGSGSLTFVVRMNPGVPASMSSLMQAVWQANPAQSIWGAATMESLLGEWLKQRRFNLTLLGAFAAIAVILALVGIYGLISYSVEQRMGELGIRRALGGRSGDILGMIVREGALLGAAGVVLGVIGALMLTRFLQGMLFGVNAIDPAIFAVLSIAVLAVAAIAALLPGVRAVRVDPVTALRVD
ncbi:MAG: ABC transporter permease [Gemmatimonadetes bacterium]|nr:ABC transporter permease [Gemmatimonadota bacterium]